MNDDAPRLYSADLSNCNSELLRETSSIAVRFAAAVERAGATVLQSVSQPFPGDALTTVLILAESHATLHTWPETRAVNIDIFCCSPRVDARAAIDELARFFGAGEVVVQEINRADGSRRLVHAR
jgi:S-adenosylmethionine decarboxylase